MVGWGGGGGNDWILFTQNYEAENELFGRARSITNTHGFSRNDVLKSRRNGGATQIADPYCCGVGAAMPVPPVWFRPPPTFFCTTWRWGFHPLARDGFALRPTPRFPPPTCPLGRLMPQHRHIAYRLYNAKPPRAAAGITTQRKGGSRPRKISVDGRQSAGHPASQ